MVSTPGVVAFVEAEQDYETAKALVEKALHDKSADFDPGFLAWRGVEPVMQYVCWKDVKELIRKNKLTPRLGLFQDQLPPEDYARQARRALFLAHELGQPVFAVVLLVDADNSENRLKGLAQARADHESFYFSDYPIVVGVPNPCREAWVLCGADVAQDKLEKLGLNFHPCQEPQRLNTKRGDARSAKKVAEHLVGQTLEEEQACWQSTPFSQFVVHGEGCGLKDFLSEVQERLAPALGL